MPEKELKSYEIKFLINAQNHSQKALSQVGCRFCEMNARNTIL